MSVPVIMTADPSPPVEDDGSQPGFFVFEPRCKVCQSPHRFAIDRMLRRGDPQASVRRHWNDAVGSAFFTANNISVHARNHLYGINTREWIEKTLRKQRVLGDPTTTETQLRPEEALLDVMETGLRLLDAGVTMPEPRDVIRAASELKKIEQQDGAQIVDAMRTEMKAFLKAVQNQVPEKLQMAIHDDFKRILDEE